MALESKCFRASSCLLVSRAKFVAFHARSPLRRTAFFFLHVVWLLEFVYLSDSTFYNPRGNYVTWLWLDVGNPPKIIEKKLWKHEAWRNRCSGKLNRQQHGPQGKNDKEPRTRTQRDILLLSSFLYSAPSKGGQTQRVLHKIAMKKSFSKRRRNHGKKK